MLHQPFADYYGAYRALEELLNLPLLQPENIRDTLHAYQMAKRCNEKRVMAEAVKWGRRGARINAIAPGIIVTPLAFDEFNGPAGISTRICLRIAPRGGRERRTKWQMRRSC